MFIKTPHQGAQTSIYAAVDPELEFITGHYFSDCKEAKTAPHAEDEAAMKWLWAVSEKWTKLNEKV